MEIKMIAVEALFQSNWGAEKWLNPAWAVLTSAEKAEIQSRLDEMFHQGLPFELKHDRIFYIYLFSLLAQLETLALQVPFKFADKLSDESLQKKMRQQLVDEVFHTLVFLKITFLLSAPYALPPTYSVTIENFMLHVAQEPDLKTSIVLLNLIGEGWIEEIFEIMQLNLVAPRVFTAVLEDESRHLKESELYLALGLPDMKYLSKRLSYYEGELVSSIFFQPKYALSLLHILGMEQVIQLISKIDEKHQSLLSKIGIKPSKKWRFYMDIIPSYMKDVLHDPQADTRIQPSLTRQVLGSLWEAPNNPTMSSTFSLNVTPLDFFAKKYPSETLTCLALQALSKGLSDNPELRRYTLHHEIYQTADAYVGIAVNLPGCGDQLAFIEFKNCHEMSVASLAMHIQNDMQFLIYCYKKIHELKEIHPHLSDLVDELIASQNKDVYPSPLMARPAISLSNIGHWGYETVTSPLFPNETIKFSLGKVERKQVWQSSSQSFDVQDIASVGISVDHRVFDANIPVPKIYQASFDAMFQQMLGEQSAPQDKLIKYDRFIKVMDQFLESDLELGFRYLFSLNTVFKNYNRHLFEMSQQRLPVKEYLAGILN
jgi:hypothetical protein